MKYYRLADNRAGKVLFGFLLFVLLYLTRTGLTASAIVGINRGQFLSLGAVCVVGVLFLLRNQGQWKAILTDRRLLVILAAAVILLLPALLKRDFQMMYLSILACVVISVFLTYFISVRDASKYYVCFLTVLAVWSVLCAYILRRLPDNGIFSVPIFFTSRKVEFYNFGLTYVARFYVKNRNFGIFREPGVHQYFLILALFLNNYALSWDKPWKYWLINAILAVTMLSTLATGGYVELALLAVIVFFDKKLYKDKRICAIAAALILLLAVFLGIVIVQQGTLYWELYGMFVSKFFPEEESFSDRYLAIMMDAQFFLNHPLLGEKIATVLHALENNTTSTMILLAVFGTGGGILHVASWFALIWEKGRKLWVCLGLCLVLFMSFNTQNLVADVFFWLFPIMALVERGLPLLKIPAKKV